MAIAQISINEDEVRKYVNEQLDSALRSALVMWDVNEMSKRTCMSKSFLEEQFLHDPRMRLLERRKEKGKRYWFYEQSVAVMKEIMDEW